MLIFLAFIFIAFACWILWFALRQWIRDSRRRKWPQAAAKVVHCGSVTYVITQTQRTSFVRGLRLEYAFELRGETYGGYFGETGFGSDIDLDRFIRDWPAGKRVTIRYNPRDPDESRLLLSDNPDLDCGGRDTTDYPLRDALDFPETIPEQVRHS